MCRAISFFVLGCDYGVSISILSASRASTHYFSSLHFSQERKAAPVVYRALQAAQQAFQDADGPIKAAKLREIVRDILAQVR